MSDKELEDYIEMIRESHTLRRPSEADSVMTERDALRSQVIEQAQRIAELEKDRDRIDTLEAWALRDPRILAEPKVRRMLIAWPETSTLRETADAIAVTMREAKGE